MEKKAHGTPLTTTLERILVDTDAFVGLLDRSDAHHHQAEHIFTVIETSSIELFTTNLVIEETITVLSHKIGQKQSCAFLDHLILEGAFPQVFVNEQLHKDALTIFRASKKKGTSFTDCANVAICQSYHLNHILSFDRIYTKKHGLTLIPQLPQFQPHEKNIFVSSSSSGSS